ncbi:MAG: zinc-binding alcohol dehydrogenase family protein [Verrucomicrobia bacterium]|nr:zinc-binding alcohol dehydrogenase family protein [Verrucomicrobiota bacterium]
MKAVGLLKYLSITDPEALVDFDLPTPVPGERDLLVKVEAVSVNPIDTKVRLSGTGQEPEPRVLGWDAAGVVLKVGTEVSRFRPGDEVYYAGSITRPGANSEFHLVDERIVGHKPITLNYAEAAALPLTTITAWESLFERLHVPLSGLQGTKTILIIGGAGGVGSIGIQLAKWAKLQVIATASRVETRKWCMALGADHVIDHRQPLSAGLQNIGLLAVDYIANFASTDLYWEIMSEVIAPEGYICAIVAGKHALDLNPLRNKSVTFGWESMFTKSRYCTSGMGSQGALLDEVAQLIDRGTLKTTLVKTVSPINAANLRHAHELIESGRTIGKIVLAGW